jgi:hypothetical protein
MSNMRALLESMTQLSTEQTQHVIEQDLSEELMLEFRRFIRKENIVSTAGNDTLQANVQATGDTVGLTPSPATGMNPAVKPAPGVNTSATPSPAMGMNPAPAPGQTIKPVAPGQANQSALAAQQVNSITNAVRDLKTINPAIDVTQAVNALTTDKVTPQNTKALDAVGTAIAPALADKSAAAQIKSLAQRLQQR